MTLPDLLSNPDVKKRICEALAEDLGPETVDATSDALVPEGRPAKAYLVARQTGILAGATVAAEVFRQVDPSIRIEEGMTDGCPMEHGDIVLTLSGSARSILVGERTALNFIQRMSGVATLTRQYVDEANNPDVKLLDTRKTTPTLRLFEKYSVLCGGGTNHRMGLYDMAMLKDNHLAYWAENHESGICGAVQAVRDRFPDRQVEVEVDTVEQLKEVLPSRPDWVLLDNMPPLVLRECVKLCEGITQTEASGGVTLDTIREIAKTGVDAISVGALTHSAPSADLALDWA
ncbi:carboxylating nicotinate-nucleotide diphosphorylase [Tichowtungia aerotolerans]|uniref:Probable nicotinate-nucleotide pyrophosphorylase [carboxylating] n=1 Tax=Tichowtungia aerotolerans TaxID=2697043 RepID=A0A6P1MIC5_9BACT|nr:carboxylating nicotinate-nucleotide diphosphorylase [Tichowtungia aerotolerans]QHI70805.1 carboxylating nicotinate-nucleotide diphosphorylase [Tichowtungia aerotolerans]